jgi:hypothetical protein
MFLGRTLRVPPSSPPEYLRFEVRNDGQQRGDALHMNPTGTAGVAALSSVVGEVPT